MSIDLHIPSTESQRERIKIEEESKFVPSQFERGSISDIVTEGLKVAKKDGEFIGFHRAIFRAATRVTYKATGQSAEVRAVLMSLYADILELKP